METNEQLSDIMEIHFIEIPKLDETNDEKVRHVKENQSTEVEYMTLLERDKEKFNEGKLEGKMEGKIEAAKALLDLLDDETIAERMGISVETVKTLREQ